MRVPAPDALVSFSWHIGAGASIRRVCGHRRPPPTPLIASPAAASGVDTVPRHRHCRVRSSHDADRTSARSHTARDLGTQGAARQETHEG
jgi:hypothetical protein